MGKSIILVDAKITSEGLRICEFGDGVNSGHHYSKTRTQIFEYLAEKYRHIFLFYPTGSAYASDMKFVSELNSAGNYTSNNKNKFQIITQSPSSTSIEGNDCVIVMGDDHLVAYSEAEKLARKLADMNCSATVYTFRQ